MKQNSYPRRSQRSPGERVRLLALYQKSGMTQRQFAKRHGLGLSTLTLWLRKEAASQVPVFVPAPNLFAEPTARALYRFQGPSGLSLEVRPGFAIDDVESLLKLLA